MNAALALVSPRDFVPTPGTKEELSNSQTLALLITGRISEYRINRVPRLLGRADLPTVDNLELTAPADVFPLAWQLPYFEVSARTAEAFKYASESAGEMDSDTKCAATLLASVAYAQLDNQRAAAEVCDSALDALADSDPVFGLLVSLQASLRYASLGEYETSVDRCARASQFHAACMESQSYSSDKVFTKTVDGLRLAVIQNTDSVESRASDSLRRRGFDPTLEHAEFWIEKDSWSRDAGEDYAAERYDIQVRDVSVTSRPVRIGGQDNVFRRYSVYFLLCELSGHWRKARDSAGLLARERMLRDPRDPESAALALALFRRYDHQKQLVSAARLVRGQGPLEALAPEAEHAVDRLYEEGVSRASLTLLRAGAELLATDRIDEAAELLVDKLTLTAHIDATGWYRTTDHVIKALSRLSPLSIEADRWLAPLLNFVHEIDDDAESAQQLSGVMSNFSWSSVSPELVQRWQDWARSHLRDDLRFLADNVLFQQARGGDETAARAIIDRFEEAPALDLAATIIDLREGLPAHLLAQTFPTIERMCADRLGEMAEEAESGSFAFGGADTPLIAAVAAQYFESEVLWSTLADFLAHPAIATSHVSRTFDWLSENLSKVPGEVVNKVLQGALGRRPTYSRFLGGDDERSSAIYRFICAAGGHSAERALVDLLELSTSSLVRDRVEAAISARFVASLATPSVVGPIVLRLATDDAVVVRNHASQGLVSLALEVDGPLRSLFYRSISTLLLADGIAEPASTLNALENEAEFGNLEVIRNLLTPLLELEVSHRSSTIRSRASYLADLVGGD